MSDSTAELTSDVKWAQVPEWVIRADISDRAVRVYALLSRRANGDQQAFPSRRYLAQGIRCSTKSVDRALEELVGIGALTKQTQFRDNRQTVNLYTLRAMAGTPVTMGGDTGVAGGRDTGVAQNESHRNESHKNTLAAAPRETVKPKTPRPPDPMFDTMVRVCGINPTTLTGSERGRINKALKELREVGATPQDIEARAKAYRTKYPEAAITPTALTGNWSALQTAKQANPVCPDCRQRLDNHDPEICTIIRNGGI